MAFLRSLRRVFGPPDCQQLGQWSIELHADTQSGFMHKQSWDQAVWLVAWRNTLLGFALQLWHLDSLLALITESSWILYSYLDFTMGSGVSYWDLGDSEACHWGLPLVQECLPIHSQWDSSTRCTLQSPLPSVCTLSTLLQHICTDLP